MNKQRGITLFQLLVVLVVAAIITVAAVAIQMYKHRESDNNMMFRIYVGPNLGAYLRDNGRTMEDARREIPVIQTYVVSRYTMAPVAGEYGKSTVSFTTLDGKMHVQEDYDNVFIEQATPEEREAYLNVDAG